MNHNNGPEQHEFERIKERFLKKFQEHKELLYLNRLYNVQRELIYCILNCTVEHQIVVESSRVEVQLMFNQAIEQVKRAQSDLEEAKFNLLNNLQNPGSHQNAYKLPHADSSKKKIKKQKRVHSIRSKSAIGPSMMLNAIKQNQEIDKTTNNDKSNNDRQSQISNNNTYRNQSFFVQT